MLTFLVYIHIISGSAAILAGFLSLVAVVYGQPQVFPEILNSSGILDILVLLIVLSLIFWMIKVYVSKLKHIVPNS